MMMTTNIAQKSKSILSPQALELFKTQLPAAIHEALTGPPVTLSPEEVTRLVQHPIRKPFNTPTDEGLARCLTDSIRNRGLLTAILLVGNQVLDGWERLNACLASGTTPMFRRLPPEAEPHAEQILMVQNFVRRHLGTGQRAMIGAQICASFEVQARQRSLDNLQGRQVLGLGKSAQRAGAVVHVCPSQIKKAKVLLGTGPGRKVWSGEWTVDKALREHRTALAKKSQIALARVHPPQAGDIRILQGDFAKVLADLANDSVDLFLTDPPYDEKSLPLWGEMVKLAARALKPGGLLAAMSGKKFLPQVLAQMQRHGLEWGWEWTIVFNGPTTSHPLLGFASRSRPLLIYYKPIPGARNYHQLGTGGEDILATDGTDQTFHPYGQKVELYEKLIRRFTNPGDLVVDPFGGGGTIAQACVNTGRKCITTEIKRQHFITIHERIFGAKPSGASLKGPTHQAELRDILPLSDVNARSTANRFLTPAAGITTQVQ